MYDTTITVIGNVVDVPRKVRVKDAQVTNFRLASTSRRYDSAAQRYVDGAPFFVDVECWGDLSAHVAGSVGQGDPVVVSGAISTDEWETDAGRRSKPKIRARAVGHNLQWGMSRFAKLARGSSSAGEAAGAGSSSDGPSDGPDEVPDEAPGEVVDPMTGEILRGRDYVTDPAALSTGTTGDLEPAHA